MGADESDDNLLYICERNPSKLIPFSKNMLKLGR